ncbi:MAG: EpsI family protein [Candidatus Omnitrophica bacterium]|nr:EpsI family protein [Candidatus Omnitrophota bacterium]MDE2213834.1 EpsI family protein [Candidatus Omnitrophota bacterium]
MPNKNKQYTIILVCFIIAALASWKFYFDITNQKDTVDIHQFPKTIAGWTSKELPISDKDKAILETTNVFARQYTNPQGKSVFLFIVYSQHNRKVSHPPEICYTGSGVDIDQDTHAVIPVDFKHLKIRTNRLLLQVGDFKQYAYYWFKVGDSFTPDYWKQQILIAFNALLGRDVGSALIRISVNVNSNKEAAIANVKEFTNLITPLLFKYLP